MMTKQNRKEYGVAPLLSYLRRLLTWERVTGVATVIGVVVACIAISPKSETEKLKEGIREKISIVEKEFKPEELLLVNDSSTYVKKLIDFQEKVLEFCILWQIMDNSRPYADFSYMSTDEVLEMMNVETRRLNKMDKIWDDLRIIQQDIINYASGLGAKNYPYLSIAKIALMGNYQTKKEKLEEEFDKAYKQKWNTYFALKGEEKAEALKEVLAELDKLKDNPIYYKVDDISLEYYIETNKLLKVSLREVVKLEKNDKDNAEGK